MYYPLGGGIAALLSKHVPGVDATAEVTAGSVANLQLIGGGKSEIGFTMADTAWDAYNGLDKFTDKKVPLRTLVVFYPNRMHVVTVEGTGVNKMTDLKGKRVSTGAPVSGTEVMSMRLLEAYRPRSQQGRDARAPVGGRERERPQGRQDRRASPGSAACPRRRSPTSRPRPARRSS